MNVHSHGYRLRLPITRSLPPVMRTLTNHPVYPIRHTRRPTLRCPRLATWHRRRALTPSTRPNAFCS
eukprot:370068-Pleurochrysis_carterae.AAC.1